MVCTIPHSSDKQPYELPVCSDTYYAIMTIESHFTLCDRLAYPPSLHVPSQIGGYLDLTSGRKI